MTDFKERYIAARRAVIARDLKRLNPMQRQAAMTTEGPLLLLAGAGSGKTTVLIQRVYNLLTYGRGSDTDQVPDWATEEDLRFLETFPDQPDEDQRRRAVRLCAVDVPKPWEIIAITFTNKAAGELKERLSARLGPAAEDVWASTFHSACVRILRRDIDRLGFGKDFTIYDTDDSKRVIRDILKEQNLDEKAFQPRSVLAVISASKDRYESPEDFAKAHSHEADWKMSRIAKVYAAYAKKAPGGQRPGLRRHHLSHRHPPAPGAGGAGILPAQVPLRAGGRVPGHQPPPVPFDQPLAGGYKTSAWWRRRPVHLPLPGANIENILNFEKQYKTPGPSAWSRTTAPPRTFWTPPTPSSATTPAARARPSGPTTALGRWSPSRPTIQRERPRPTTWPGRCSPA